MKGYCTYCANIARNSRFAYEKGIYRYSGFPCDIHFI